MGAHQARRLLAEAVGTALLVFFGCGAILAALTASGGEALSYAALGMVALAFGLVIAVAVHAFGSTSGAHINPAVSVALAAAGRFPWREVPPYVAAQTVGALAGAALLALAFGGAAVDLGVGQTTIADGASYGQAIVSEAAGTYLLVTAIMALAVDRRAAPGWAGLMIGLAVTAAILVTAPIAGGSYNPARTFGPLLVTAIGGGDAAWGDLAAYLIGPLAGGAAAAFAYDAIARPRAAEAAAEPAQGTQGDITGSRTDRRRAITIEKEEQHG